MNKQEFLSALEKGLAGLPKDDVSERLGFYGELIDDGVEEGLTEAEAVEALGPIGESVTQTVAQTPLKKLVRERVKRRRGLKGWQTALIILGSPVWLPLAAAAFAVLLSLYIVLWALLISLWAIFLSFAVSAAAAAAAGVVQLFRGQTLQGLALMGAGLLLAGLSIFLFFGCAAASRGVVRLTGKIALWIKSLFVGKENNYEE